MRTSDRNKSKAPKNSDSMKKKLAKKKKIDNKTLDSISETISFVIKGHLTSLKPTVLAKQKMKIKRVVPPVKSLKILKSNTSGDQSCESIIDSKKNNSNTVKKDKKVSPKVDKALQTKQIKKCVVSNAKKPKLTKNIDKMKMVNANTKKTTTKLAKSKLPKKDIEITAPDTKNQHRNDSKLHTENNKSNSAIVENDFKADIKKKIKMAKEKISLQQNVRRLSNKTKKVDSSRNSKKESLRKKNPFDKQIGGKIKREGFSSSSDEFYNSCDEVSLVSLSQQRNLNKDEVKNNKSFESPRQETNKIKYTATKSKILSNKRKAIVKDKLKNATNRKMFIMKKKLLNKEKEDKKMQKMKLYSFWNGPKRHRVASLNALAKVHCLYENETRNALLDDVKNVVYVKKEKVEDTLCQPESPSLPTRNLRAAPRLGAVGKHWDMHEMSSSSSEDNESEIIEKPKNKIIVKRIKQEETTEKNNENDQKSEPEKKRRRNRTEIIMDLKDMVVRKRMASLNASAILAASYSNDKKSSKSPISDETYDSSDSDESFIATGKNISKKIEDDIVKKEEDTQVIELRATPNKKVSVILNQDTDVTITGVYVNSTTRSTHHEGYCSIAGMQYRISATSHTQTAATAMAAENILQSPGVSENKIEGHLSPTCKSYTPLGALSNMKPPGAQESMTIGHSPHLNSGHVVSVGPAQHGSSHLPSTTRRHPNCTSAFSAPPSGHYGTPPTHPVSETGYTHGYYQPAGPLITAPPLAGHLPQQVPPPTIAPTKSVPLSEPSTSPTPPPPTLRPPPPSSATESSDSDVIITSPPVVKETLPSQPPPAPPISYRFSQYSTPHHGYSYAYPQYYPGPPPPTYPHPDICYSNPPYLHKSYPTAYRRYLTAPAGTQFFQATPPDIYNPPQPTANPPGQQMVSANTGSPASSYQQPSGGHLPPSSLIESYVPPPTLLDPYPPHYYSGYGPPPPTCYNHPPPTRSIPFLNAAYSSCPCPMQSCPKNVHAGPLTGDSKRSVHMSIAKDSIPLPPVALALPLEPVSATGPPSPARGSAGMPPPPSPAGATYQPPPPVPKQESINLTDCKPVEKCRKARVGKSMVRNNIAANFPENTMLLMCHAPQQNENITNVKREIESPEQKKEEKYENEELPLTNITTHCESNITSLEESNVTLNHHNDEISGIEDKTFNLKEENEDDDGLEESENSEKANEKLLPCVKTVAENVKMKNMKRKLSFSKESENKEISPATSPKKTKVGNCKSNGSYKDLIKKHIPSVKINNGKRKLITDEKDLLPKRLTVTKSSKKKRKIGLSKEEQPELKRVKFTKPLASNNHIISTKCVKGKNGIKKMCASSESNENTEPGVKITKVQKCNGANKKLCQSVNDNLLGKSNIDRIIESVVSSSCREPCITRTKTAETAKKNDASSKPLSKLKLNKVESDTVAAKNAIVKNEQFKPKGQKIIARKKSKSKEEPPVCAVISIPRKSVLLPKWSNGWTWDGESFQAKVFLNSDEATVLRTCYPAMVHVEGDRIEIKDCVLLKAGQRKNELPFVAKVAALWENPDDGEMMMSLLWYYRPEHTEQGPQPTDEHDEVFASRHKDTNSVACIEDKCYVLTFNEYCRYRKNLRRLEENLEEKKPFIPNPEVYPRMHRQPKNPRTPSDLIFFCRRVYDFRQKRIVKNPS